MNPEQLEFAISQYLDGSLPAEEVAALEARLNEDAAARGLLAEYRRVDALLKGTPSAVPAIEWGRLAGRIGAAVQEADELQFALCQYADGTLTADQVPVVEAKLARDGELAASVEEHRRLSDLLKSGPLPAVRWERLAEHLAETVAEANEPATATIKLFARPWVRGVAGLAMAACVALAGAIGIRAYLSGHGPQIAKNVQVITGTNGGVAINPKPIDVQIGPGAGTGAGATSALAEITIGAGSDQGNGDSPAFADGIITRSPRSLIASGAPVAQDTAQMPY
jgi:anti-sigma factor RsiW